MTSEPATGFLRIPYVARCTVHEGGRKRRGTICNLALNGLYIHLQPVPEGEVEVIFPLPDGGPPVAAIAEVTWANDAPPDGATAPPVGCGVRFLELAPAERERIEALIEAFRRDPEPLVGLVQPRSGLTRVPLVVPCALVGGFGHATGATCNLSAQGIYAAVDRIPDVGESVEVSLELPRWPGRFDCAGVVTWQNLDRPESLHAFPPGCGLRFERLDGPRSRHLAALVDEYLAALPEPPA
ncbi:MAG TPA: PilZ domain-containing protein [Thermoanaerobaculia bacterium]|nr:PilZ domain-containing protein [Thermoanaerobaculia bacterium]